MNAMIGNSLLLDNKGYQISRSVRLRSSASAYFNRTLGAGGGTTKNAFSIWVKRGSLGAQQAIFQARQDASNQQYIGFTAGDAIEVGIIAAGSTVLQKISTSVYRDPSAWYNIIFLQDTTLASAEDRYQLWINGVRVTAWSTNTNTASQNTAYFFGTPNPHFVGAYAGTASFFDGYFTEANFVYQPSSTPVVTDFGETNAVTGVWQPKKYTGTYGTNGFYLNFSDNSAATAAAIGKDYSGNGNNFTPNNISVTAGATYDSMLDVPTQWADGGNGRGNYVVLNPISTLGNGTVSDANLTFVNGVLNTWKTVPSSMFQTSGKFYYEATVTGFSAANYTMTGVIGPPATRLQDKNTLLTTYVGAVPNGWGVQSVSAGSLTKYNNASGTSVSNASITLAALNDVFQVAVDVDAGKIWFGKNNVWLEGSPSAGTTPSYTITPQPLSPAISCYSNAGDKLSANFGQRPFSYTPPTGFKALNTLNLPTPTILKGNQYMDATLYTGNGGTQSITNSGGMQPDFVWLKSRSSTDDNSLFDSVRGATKRLVTNTTNVEATTSGVTSFDSSGFSLGAATSNVNAATYVGWQWKEGATQGFDIVTYTGTGVARTVAHNLGVAPAMIIVKNRTATGTQWRIYRNELTAANYISFTTSIVTTDSTAWNNTEPTSSVFTVGTATTVNQASQEFVAYLFADVEGFSKFRAYRGNSNADGPFEYLGFRPAFVMIKCVSTTAGWVIIDAARNKYNVANLYLRPNLSGVELVGTPSTVSLDFLSNGFKVRSTQALVNSGPLVYTYSAFAENPFKNALAR